MSKAADDVVCLTGTLTLCEYRDTGNKGFWLYDETRGMNLAMRAKTEREAFIEALTYYQERLMKVEGELRTLKSKVDAFVDQIMPPEEGD